MAVRRRLLPTAIVGGLLATGMAAGVGTAEAAPTCSGYDIVNPALVSSDGDGKCVATLSLPKYGVSKGDVLTADQLLAAAKAGLLVDPTTVTVAPPPTRPTPATTTTTAPAPAAAPTTVPSKSTTTKPVPAAAAVPPPAAVAPQAPALAAGAVGVAPVAGLLDATYSPALLSHGVYDPSLLLGAAPGVAPMLGLGSSDPASAVTTASQVQALALQAPGGLGLPAVAGVVVLAGLGGVAVRYRLRRAAARVATSS